MNEAATDTPQTVDVLIVGAGISGIGAAYHLKHRRPGTSFAILEARADIGGTWDLFRYPGIRSDSDLFTFGYDFKPWVDEKVIADGPAIKAYLAETVAENDLGSHIRFRHKVTATEWSSAEHRWTVKALRSDTGTEAIFKARWIFAAGGYYRYDEGYTPAFPGRERFQGQVIHPQHWPEELDYRGKRVLVIGSGATAVTLVPAMADEAAHVIMLQRTPTYVMPVPTRDALAKVLRQWFGHAFAHRVTRRFNIAKQRWVYAFCQKYPQLARRIIRKMNADLLPADYPVDVHFNPPYGPWDQRLCAVPGGDLFRVISRGKASVVTDRIRTFDETGVVLESGEHLPADVIITATGLNLQPFGGLQPVIDGKPVLLKDTVAFKGMMLSGVPNLVFAIGYTSSSWTLKVGLVCEHFCRLLEHMERHDLDVATPMAEPGMETRPLLNFGAGYVQRSLQDLPRQGLKYPWLMSFDYVSDAKIFRNGRVEDSALKFTHAH